MSKRRNTLKEPTPEERAAYVKLSEAYPFEYTLSGFFAREVSKALYREELLEVYDFLEKLLHNTCHEEESE